MKILDSSVIILFISDINEKICLELLSLNGESILVPTSVYDEILSTKIKKELDDLILKNKIIKVTNNNNTEKTILRKRFPTLGNGELNVIMYGKKLQQDNKEFYCVIDDYVGRKVAKKLGLPLTGSIGLIKTLKENGILDDGKIREIVNKIKRSPFRIDETILGGLINE